MNFRRHIVLLFGLFLLVSGLAISQLSAAPASETLARVHWLGLKQISTDTNSAHFMSVWQLPQTAALVAQTLDKLSRCPGGDMTNAASARLRPLLDDLVSSESYMEVYAPTNLEPAAHNAQIFLAVRLPADRARLWQTNLAAFKALTGTRPVPAGHGGWLEQSHAPDRIEFSRIGEWTLVGFGLDTNILQSEFAARIARNRAPTTANSWLEADIDLARLSARVSGGEVGLNIHLTAMGETGNVLTRGTLNFSRPLDLPLPPWEVPANLIHQPLTSFTAVRGVAAWLAALPAWQKIQLTPSPDQAYFWVQSDMPFQTYFAAPLPGASNQLWQLAGHLVQNANPWLATNGQGSFQWISNPPGLVWNNLFIISPFLKPVVVNQHDFLLGGLYPQTPDDSNPPPAAILHAVFGTTNLVYYQTEQTGLQVEDDLFFSQLFRLVFQKPQLPAAAATTVWLKKIEPLLGDSTTFVTQTGAEQFAFTRHSTVGFTGLELQLLADWLESPQFPHGLHTFLAPPDK